MSAEEYGMQGDTSDEESEASARCMPISEDWREIDKEDIKEVLPGCFDNVADARQVHLRNIDMTIERWFRGMEDPVDCDWVETFVEVVTEVAKPLAGVMSAHALSFARDVVWILESRVCSPDAMNLGICTFRCAFLSGLLNGFVEPTKIKARQGDKYAIVRPSVSRVLRSLKNSGQQPFNHLPRGSVLGFVESAFAFGDPDVVGQFGQGDIRTDEILSLSWAFFNQIPSRHMEDIETEECDEEEEERKDAVVIKRGPNGIDYSQWWTSALRNTLYDWMSGATFELLGRDDQFRAIDLGLVITRKALENDRYGVRFWNHRHTEMLRECYKDLDLTMARVYCALGESTGMDARKIVFKSFLGLPLPRTRPFVSAEPPQEKRNRRGGLDRSS